MKRRHGALVALAVLSALVLSMVGGAGASSHREAPLISEDPVADGTDLYAWVVNPDAPAAQRRLAIVSNWIPLQEPASGPNFWKFGDDVLYAIHIDNDGDAREDISYYWRFQTTVKEPGTFLYNNNVVTVSTNASGEAVDYPGLNVQQSYTLTEIRDGKKTSSRSGMLTPPVNVGIRSTNTATSYAALAAAANYKRRRHRYQGVCRAKGRDLPGRPRIDLRSGRPPAVQQPSSGARGKCRRGEHHRWLQRPQPRDRSPGSQADRGRRRPWYLDDRRTA